MIVNENFLKKIFEISFSQPLKPAIVQNKKTLTYEELIETIIKYVITLEQEGIKQTERIIILLPNCKEFIISLYAIMILKAIAVPVSFISKSTELKKIFKDCTPSAIISLVRMKKIINETDYEFHRYFFIDEKETESDDLLPNKICFLYRAIQKIRNPEREIHDYYSSMNSENRILSINYTYNGTGVLKGCIHTLKSYSRSVEYIYRTDDINKRKISLAALPFNNIFAAMACILPFLAYCDTVIILKHFNIDAFYDLIQKYKVTHTAVVPAITSLMQKNLKEQKNKLKSLRIIVTGADFTERKILEHLSSDLPCKLCQGYGLTEFFVVSRNREEHNKFGTLGIPLHDNIELKTVTTELKDKKNLILKELWIKSPTGFSGYWNNNSIPDINANEAWFATGDLIEIDSDGYLHFKGRKKNITKVGGLMVDLKETENAFLSIKGIQQVTFEITPHPFLSNRISAFIKCCEETNHTAKSIKMILKKQMASYKIPSSIHIT